MEMGHNVLVLFDRKKLSFMPVSVCYEACYKREEYVK
jgi:hypothetical protein